MKKTRKYRPAECENCALHSQKGCGKYWEYAKCPIHLENVRRVQKAHEVRDAYIEAYRTRMGI